MISTCQTLHTQTLESPGKALLCSTVPPGFSIFVMDVCSGHLAGGSLLGEAARGDLGGESGDAREAWNWNPLREGV